MPDSPAQCQSADASRRNNSARSGEPEDMRRMIDIAPGASSAYGYRARHGVNARVFHRREVDDQAIITNSQASRVVSATPDGQNQTLASRKIYRLNYVRDVATPCHQSRPFMNHSIVHFARVIVSFVARLDYRAS